ncbi:MAG: radical SAM protein [Proteobacteria bacterium]|nr:radical SAM protein [Pseudomonadota bacterium]
MMSGPEKASTEYNAFQSWKCLLYRRHFEEILRGRFLAPITLHIYPTNRCNLNCQWCIMRGEQKENRDADLSPAVFEELIQSANNMGIQSIHISGGGEPLLYQHLEMLESFKGLKVLSTNGIELGFDPFHIFDRVRVSLDAGSWQVWAHKTRPRKTDLKLYAGKAQDTFDAILSSIGHITMNKKVPKEIGLGFVLDKWNYLDVFNFCLLGRELNVDFLHIRPAYYPRGTEQEYRVRGILEAAGYHIKAATKLIDDPEIYAISEKFKGFWNPPLYDRCLATPLHAVVTATGELIVCQDNFIRFGDLNKKPLEAIWGRDEHKEAIKKINLQDCPRCVLSRCNEVMQHVFLNNGLLKELL